jgi:hypothetical protein
MADIKKTKHLQSKYLVNLGDLLKCAEEVDTVDFVLAIDPDCPKVVKISIANLAAQIEAL